MKKIIIIFSIAAMSLFCGCKTESCTDTGPVAPKEQSYEHSNAKDPVLPHPHVWWN